MQEPVSTSRPPTTARQLPPAHRHESGRLAVQGWVDRLLAQGLYHFTPEEAYHALGEQGAGADVALSRLVARGRLVRPVKGLYVLVRPEHRLVGAPPPLSYIDPLMHHLGQPYYVALLSAAALHGASQQAPQELQVITDSWRPSKTVGRGRIRWIRKERLAMSATQVMQIQTGNVVVSTVETTAADLVRYRRYAGYLDNVATLLADLGAHLRAERLVDAVHGDLPTAQRLGFLLRVVGHGDLADAFRALLDLDAARLCPLDPAAPTEGALRDHEWRLLVNTDIDPD